MTRTAVLLAALVVTLGACSSNRAELTGFVREPNPDVGSFSLPDVTVGGAEFNFVAPADGVLVMYFGYTSCPDVCPTTMSDLRRALERLGDDAESGDGRHGHRRPRP